MQAAPAVPGGRISVIEEVGVVADSMLVEGVEGAEILAATGA